MSTITKRQTFWRDHVLAAAAFEGTIAERVVTADKSAADAASGYVVPRSLFKTDLFGACSRHG